MKREKIIKVESHAVLMPYNNIDTDQIIPADFLKITKKENLSNQLFYHFRYNTDRSLKKESILNQKISQSAKILIAADNFGCGSSREHAAWALYDYGFRVIVAKSFADIFKNNALNIGLLPVVVNNVFYDEIIEQYSPELMFKVDLFYQTINIINSYADKHYKFSISSYRKECLMNGFDNIDYLQSIKNEIIEYEQSKI